MSNRSVRVWCRSVAMAAAALFLAACGSGSPAEQSSAQASDSVQPPATSPAGSAVSSSVASTASPRSAAAGSLSSVTSGGAAATGSAQAADYCRQRGGEVQTRAAYWGTNGDQSDWLPLRRQRHDVPVPGR